PGIFQYFVGYLGCQVLKFIEIGYLTPLPPLLRGEGGMLFVNVTGIFPTSFELPLLRGEGRGEVLPQIRLIPHPNKFLLIGKFFRSEEHTSELQSRENLVCRLLLEK